MFLAWKGFGCWFGTRCQNNFGRVLPGADGGRQIADATFCDMIRSEYDCSTTITTKHLVCWMVLLRMLYHAKLIWDWVKNGGLPKH